MNIIENTAELDRIESGSVLTIGNFDGVHLGHQQIFEEGKRAARKSGVNLVAMTFEPHPVALLHPEKAPAVLTPLELKKNLLARCGLDWLIVLKDNFELLKLSPTDFVDQFLMKNLKPSLVVEGEDFNFGKNRTGSIDTLKQLALRRAFEVSVVESRKIKISTNQTVKASSTMIRYMLESGHVADAAVVLGRRYSLIGKIIPGRGKGKEIGFPTLNMEKAEQVIPAEGVYAGFVEIGESFEQVRESRQKLAAVFSIGQARTFGDDYPLLIEAHLLRANPKGQAGKWMAMDFVRHIRPQHKFADHNDLVKQIEKDCQSATHILKNKIN